MEQLNDTTRELVRQCRAQQSAGLFGKFAAHIATIRHAYNAAHAVLFAISVGGDALAKHMHTLFAPVRAFDVTPLPAWPDIAGPLVMLARLGSMATAIAIDDVYKRRLRMTWRFAAVGGRGWHLTAVPFWKNADETLTTAGLALLNKRSNAPRADAIKPGIAVVHLDDDPADGERWSSAITHFFRCCCRCQAAGRGFSGRRSVGRHHAAAE